MDLALQRHDSLIRASIEEQGGLVFKTVGDAFCATFESVSMCIVAATDGAAGAATGGVVGERVGAGPHGRPHR